MHRSASQVHPTYVLPHLVHSGVIKSPSGFRDLHLTTEEKNWLANTCPYFSREYLEYLSGFQFDPAQIAIRFIPVSDDGEQGKVEIEASGLWKESILWEVPVMACLSELYFQVGATDWSYDGQKGEHYALYSSSWVKLASQRVRPQRHRHCCKRDVSLANSGLEEGGHSMSKTSSSQP